MKTLTDKLADALRNMLDEATTRQGSLMAKQQFPDEFDALAEYDAQRALQLPTPYRVTWEIDAFNASTPREAAEEAFAAIVRAGTTTTCFTVRAADGTVTEIDLIEDETT